MEKIVKGYIKNEDDGTLEELPTFINLISLTYEIFSSSNNDAGNYTIVTEISYDINPDISVQCELELDVLEFEVSPTITNSKPYLVFNSEEDFLDFSSLTVVCGH